MDIELSMDIDVGSRSLHVLIHMIPPTTIQGQSSPTEPLSRSHDVPDVAEIRRRAMKTFGLRPCLWQCEFAQAILRREKDVLLEVATGMGKTLSFWLPLLFRPTGIQVVVTALNAIGRQCVESLAKVGIRAVSIDGTLRSNQMQQAFHVSTC